MIAALALAAAPPVQVAAITCGGTAFHVASRAATGPNPPLAPATQTLTRRVGASEVPVPLDRTRPASVDGRRVADRYLSSWACVTGAGTARFLLLGYACATDDGCGGRKEWVRLLDPRGRTVDAGVPQDGPARDRLNTRLGIARAMAAGVQMVAVVR